ncbi:MAG TPA: 3-isopropylmalate dehydrogenase [Thermomicrobiales bacterium]|nr:3-isopropylmalate dehydrogenase [Thermomicrobiales bacterium]
MSSRVTADLVLLSGDGVGPEVMAEAVKTLEAVGRRFGHRFGMETALFGGAAIDAYGVPLRDDDIRRCRVADGVLLGAVGGPKWDGVERELRPEAGLLRLRKSLRLFANLRPASVLPALIDASPVRPEIVRDVDLLVVRELTGGIYFGRPSRRWRNRRGGAALDTMIYREPEIERVGRLAFELARARRGLVTSVDKANVLQTSRLWRETISRLAGDYPDVRLEHMLVDAMAMHLVRSPARFDVVVTENLFGDILTDEASVLAGSIGMLPSASLGLASARRGGRRFGLYEPIHGSAPDIAGQGKANPAGMILSAAMLLRTTLGLADEATAVERAVAATVAAGVRTPDIATGAAVTTAEFGDAVSAAILDA